MVITLSVDIKLALFKIVFISLPVVPDNVLSVLDGKAP